jgi:hypothetical protein
LKSVWPSQSSYNFQRSTLLSSSFQWGFMHLSSYFHEVRVWWPFPKWSYQGRACVSVHMKKLDVNAKGIPIENYVADRYFHKLTVLIHKSCSRKYKHMMTLRRCFLYALYDFFVTHVQIIKAQGKWCIMCLFFLLVRKKWEISSLVSCNSICDILCKLQMYNHQLIFFACRLSRLKSHGWNSQVQYYENGFIFFSFYLSKVTKLNHGFHILSRENLGCN